jgi:predicted dehydrogenase
MTTASPTPGKTSVLIVGAGSIGERHLRCFQQAGRARLALCEINANLRGEVAERYGITRTFGDLEEALGNPLEAAVIATPAHLHVSMALRAINAGVHVLIEKPLSVAPEGVLELAQAVVSRRRVAAVAYVYRAHESLAAMKRALAEARFGAPVQLVASSAQHFPTYRPAYRDTYYRDHATGGGAIQDALTHLLDAGQWLVGPIDRLVADAAHQVLPGVAVEDTAHVLARHGSVLACYYLNQYQAPNETSITVVCERGTVRFEYHRSRWLWQTAPDEPWHEEAASTTERDALFIAQAQAFLDAVAGERPPLCSLEEGMRAFAAQRAVLESVERRSWVEPQTFGSRGRCA